MARCDGEGGPASFGRESEDALGCLAVQPPSLLSSSLCFATVSGPGFHIYTPSSSSFPPTPLPLHTFNFVPCLLTTATVHLLFLLIF